VSIFLARCLGMEDSGGEGFSCCYRGTLHAYPPGNHAGMSSKATVAREPRSRQCAPQGNRRGQTIAAGNGDHDFTQEITQEVAPNENQRGPKGEAVRSADFLAFLCGGRCVVPISDYFVCLAPSRPERMTASGPAG
jgi:hypothetical protein